MTGADYRLVTTTLTTTVILVSLTSLVVVASDDLMRHRHNHQQQKHGHPVSLISVDSQPTGAGYRCDDVCELRQSVQRLSASQSDYARALHAVYGLVDTVRRHILSTRSQSRVTRQNRDADLYVNRTLIRRLTGGVRRRNCCKSVRNLTSVVGRCMSQLDALETRDKETQSALNDVTNRLDRTSAAVELSDRQCMSLVEQVVAKQTNINANLLRKVSMLEKMLHTMFSHHHQQQQQQHSPLNGQNTQDDALAQGACLAGYVRHASSCYQFVNVSKNWIEAEKHCQMSHVDSHLISIETRAEMDAIIDYRMHNAAQWSSRYIWTGANDMATENRWTWVGTGREVGAEGGYTAWRAGQPDNGRGDQHCMYADAGQTGRPYDNSVQQVRRMTVDGWNDWNCHAARLNFVCEIVLKP